MTTTRSTYFVQTSTDGGKTFATVKRTTIRLRAFTAFLNLDPDARALLFQDNTALLATHAEDLR
jgi:hypothetical protein